jgi:hypothetical protein
LETHGCRQLGCTGHARLRKAGRLLGSTRAGIVPRGVPGVRREERRVGKVPQAGTADGRWLGRNVHNYIRARTREGKEARRRCGIARKVLTKRQITNYSCVNAAMPDNGIWSLDIRCDTRIVLLNEDDPVHDSQELGSAVAGFCSAAESRTSSQPPLPAGNASKV